MTESGTVGLTWTEGAYNGGSPIIDYRLSYDQSTGVWIELATGVSTTSYSAMSLTPDAIYAFRVEARNSVGYSASPSAEVSVRAAAKPTEPSAPSTVTVSNSDVTVSWTPPYDGGSTITAYAITIR